MLITDPYRVELIRRLRDCNEAKPPPYNDPTGTYQRLYDRTNRLIEWLGSSNEPLGTNRFDYPCDLCEAEPQELCDFTRQGGDQSLVVLKDDISFHSSRGFDQVASLPGYRWDSHEPLQTIDCVASVQTIPGRANGYRGCCLGCGFTGVITDDEVGAVEESMTHAWPRWRELPVVPEIPRSGNRKNMVRWLEAILPVMPDWWIEGVARTQSHPPALRKQYMGPPVRTQRPPDGDAPRVKAMPGGGYDMSAGETPPVVEVCAARASSTSQTIASLARKMVDDFIGRTTSRRTDDFENEPELDEADGDPRATPVHVLQTSRLDRNAGADQPGLF